MKKFFIIFFILLFLTPTAFCENVQEIKFIYINGSNNNDKKMKKWFYNGMNKLHSYVFTTFSKSDFIKNNLLKNGKYKISELPEAYFWGDKTIKELKSIDSDLKESRFSSPKIAQSVRSLFAHYIHDAIWVSHYYNMHPVIEDLHRQILANSKKNNGVILMGYSAGAFISYEYIFNKLPYINLYDYYLYKNSDKQLLGYIKTRPMKNTCIDALIETNLAVFSADGDLIPIMNTDDFYIKYSELNKYTSLYCTPDNTLKGIINFASPLSLFYSNLLNPDYPLNYYNKLLYKYLIENDMFWLTVNYSDDPMSYTMRNNFSYSDLKDKLNIEIKPDKGFIYESSNIKSGRTFLFAHTSYWSTAKRFSKSLVNAYEEGYKFFNDNNL